MMKDYLKNITPDSFTGLIFAMEGIDRTVVLVNGPTGCKFYHSAISDSQTIHQHEFDPLKYPERYYFGQPRVPCTFLDSKDYVYGSKDKLEETLHFLNENIPFDLLVVINSPGASLIGDDLKGIVNGCIGEKEFIVIETSGFSQDICKGYEKATGELLKQLDILRLKKLPDMVNILGISIFHRDYLGDIEEIQRLLQMCGIKVNCFLCAQSSLKDIKNISRASLNIVIHPEYGYHTALLLKELYDTPYYICDGPPIGFTATENFIEDICSILNKDNSKFMEESGKARADAYVHISRVNSMTGLPKGVKFALEGNYSEIYSYAGFLVNYFGMILETVSVLNEDTDLFKGELEDFLKTFNLYDSINKDILKTKSELVFANGNTIAKLKLKKYEFTGIETSLPSLGYINVIPKTHLGLKGALMIVEQVLNGLMFY